MKKQKKRVIKKEKTSKSKRKSVIKIDKQHKNRLQQTHVISDTENREKSRLNYYISY